MWENINFITTVASVIVIIVIGAFVKSIKGIYSLLDREFVKKITCLSCQAEIKSEIYKDSNYKYNEVQKQIQKNHDEWTKEIKDIRKEAAERAAILARIDGKLDTLLGNQNERKF